MASRFWLVDQGTPPISPAFDAGWEQTGQADRKRLLLKRKSESIVALANSTNITVPITTTQDILCRQFISDPFVSVSLVGTVSLVIRCSESATTANVTLAAVLKIVDQFGNTPRTLFSTFNTDTEFAAAGSDATRIVNAQAITTTTLLAGDRLVLELGGHAAGPTAATTYLMRFGNAATSDFALTSALTTDLNPWLELSADLHTDDFSNTQSVRAADGISVTERTR